MGLDVPRCFCHGVLMNESTRRDLGELIKAKRIEKFGTSTAAEREAQVNNATWKRAENGLAVRDDRLAAIIKALWPETGGAWNRINEPTPEAALPTETATTGAEGLSDEQLLAELADRMGLEVTLRPKAAQGPASAGEGQKNLGGDGFTVASGHPLEDRTPEEVDDPSRPGPHPR